MQEKIRHSFLRLLISWLQSPSAVILEPKKIKSVSPSISHEVMGPDAMIFVFWMLSFKPTISLSSFTFHFHALEKEMATHSSVLAWRIPWTEKPGRLQSMGSHRVRHDWSDLAAAAAGSRKWKKYSFKYCAPEKCGRLNYCSPVISSSPYGRIFLPHSFEIRFGHTT